MKRKEDDYFDEEVSDFLNHYAIEYPDETEIEQTVHSLRKHVPKKRKRLDTLLENMEELMLHSTRELSHIGFLFWSSNLLFFILGLAYVLLFEGNPYMTLMFLSPVPLVIGLVEVFKGRESGALEIELSCKYSAYQIMFSRFLIVGLFNLTLNVCMVVSFSAIVPHVFLLKLLGYWMIPNVVVASVGLFLAMRTRNDLIIPALLSVWTAFTLFAGRSDEWMRQVESLSPIVYGAIIVLFSWFLFVQLIKLKRGDWLAIKG